MTEPRATGIVGESLAVLTLELWMRTFIWRICEKASSTDANLHAIMADCSQPQAKSMGEGNGGALRIAADPQLYSTRFGGALQLEPYIHRAVQRRSKKTVLEIGVGGGADFEKW